MREATPPTIAAHLAGPLEANSPLGTGRQLSNERMDRIAERVGRTPARVLLRWCVQRGRVVLPKSTHRERIEENAQTSTSRSPTTTWPPTTRRAKSSARERKWW